MTHEEQVALGAPGVIYFDAITAALASRQLVLDAALVQLKLGATTLAEVASRLVETLRSRHKVLIAGNGGSAAGAQHLAAELIGRFKREREAYAVLSLTTDTAILTAVANDYGYQDVFARQVSGLGQPGDLLIVFSTSGESENLARATMAARKQRMVTIAVTGDRLSRLERLADLTVRVPAADTALVQELHLVVTHLLCDIVESELAAWKEAAGS